MSSTVRRTVFERMSCPLLAGDVVSVSQLSHFFLSAMTGNCAVCTTYYSLLTTHY